MVPLSSGAYPQRLVSSQHFLFVSVSLVARLIARGKGEAGESTSGYGDFKTMPKQSLISRRPRCISGDVFTIVRQAAMPSLNKCGTNGAPFVALPECEGGFVTFGWPFRLR